MLNCLDYVLTYDDNFIEEWKQATVHNISVHQNVALEALEVELALPKPPVVLDCCELRISKYFDKLRDNDGNDLTTLQSALDAIPFCDLIVQSILANKIPVKTKWILWHQRLGHPCNEYLYSAQKIH